MCGANVRPSLRDCLWLQFDEEYSAEVYSGETVKIIAAAAAEAQAGVGAKPFFVYLAFANTHEPLEAPQRFQDLYPSTMQPKSRLMLGAMVSSMDEGVGNSKFTSNLPVACDSCVDR